VEQARVDELLRPYKAATKVRAEVFKESGKWAYTVRLDYSRTPAIIKLPSGWIDPEEAAVLALETATIEGTSEVRFARLPERWTMFVPEPPNGWPIMVRGGFAGLADALYGGRDA
jgi:hypothetical protein